MLRPGFVLLVILLATLFITMAKEYISFYSFNATSISGIDKLQSFNRSFSGSTYDVISVAETWFHEGIEDEEILPTCNYAIFRCERNDNNSHKVLGGGAMLAVHKSLSAIRRDD